VLELASGVVVVVVDELEAGVELSAGAVVVVVDEVEAGAD
jgi:hypothetical protein